jgi:hypothetical protein
MKKLGLGLLSATLLLVACKKNNDKATLGTISSFTMGEGKGDTTILTTLGSEYSNGFIFSDAVTSTFTGTASQVYIHLDSMILSDGQTYTYSSADSVGYNPVKNFKYAAVYLGYTYKNGVAYPQSGAILDKLVSGVVTVKKTDDGYGVSYNLKYSKHTITGKYVGKMSHSEKS